ncbi:MAG: polyprenyl synthetase family protein [Alistipes indistinctus]
MLSEATRSGTHEMSEGELTQTELSESLRMTRELYLDIIMQKNRIAVGGMRGYRCHFGQRNARTDQAMRDSGTNLGIAFQIKDDILDFSPMEVTGKPMCGDMRERKITLPLLYVLENSSEAEHGKLIGKLSDIRQRPPMSIASHARYANEARPRTCRDGDDPIPRQSAYLAGELSRIAGTRKHAAVRRLRSGAQQINPPRPSPGILRSHTLYFHRTFPRFGNHAGLFRKKLYFCVLLTRIPLSISTHCHV